MSSITVAGSEKSFQKTIDFYIPRQRADASLTLFAEQANLTLIFPFDKVQGITANRLVGSYTPEEAVDILLKDTR